MKLRYQEEARTRISYLKQVAFFVLTFVVFHVFLIVPPLSQASTHLLAGVYGLVTYATLMKVGKYSHLAFGPWSQKPRRFFYLYAGLFGTLLIGGIAGLISFQPIELAAVGIISMSSVYIGINIGRANTLNKELDAEESRSEAYTSKVVDALLARNVSLVRELTREELERGRQMIRDYNRGSILRSDAYSLVISLVSIPCLFPLVGVWGAIGVSGAISYASNVMYLNYAETGLIENREMDFDVHEWRKEKVREELTKDETDFDKKPDDDK